MESNNQNFNLYNQNQMFNPMLNNGMMPNQMNNIYNPLFNGMIPNQMFNPMMNGMLPNQIFNPMFNGILPNQNFINNEVTNQMNFMNINNNCNNIINTPIEGATLLEQDNNEEIKYYFYPKIEFTEEETKNSKTLLIIGQTGHGKTTFMNALVNIYMGINFHDKFRYLLVLNENKNQLKSITKEITLYKIRSKKELNFPPLIIIDTPGFGDTDGVKGDKINLVKFGEFFNSEKINYINCILYITIGANSRFGETDKNIINYLLNLFGKNVKNNFVVGATNFIPESKKDIPNIIKSLSNEDHYYYQNVLKDDKLSREQIIKSYWYFTSDNKIISNNEIEGNEREKEKWKYTEKEIKNFIENKLENLEKKSAEESKNVLNNRIQLENEIDSFTEKINVLFSKMGIVEYNISEQNKYLELIIAIRDKIRGNICNINNISAYLREIDVALPSLKKIMTQKIETFNVNLICKACQSNCHKNCKCFLSTCSKWFCCMFSFNGICKICNHHISEHEKGKIIFIQKEGLPVPNEFEKIENKIKILSNKNEEEKLHIDTINKDNNLLQKTLDIFNKEIDNCKKEIEKAKIQKASIENELIETLNKIKNNLLFLEQFALNKEKRTIKTFIEDYAKSKNIKEKELIENIYQKYISLDKNNKFK